MLKLMQTPLVVFELSVGFLVRIIESFTDEICKTIDFLTEMDTDAIDFGVQLIHPAVQLIHPAVQLASLLGNSCSNKLL